MLPCVTGPGNRGRFLFSVKKILGVRPKSLGREWEEEEEERAFIQGCLARRTREKFPLAFSKRDTQGRSKHRVRFRE